MAARNMLGYVRFQDASLTDHRWPRRRAWMVCWCALSAGVLVLLRRVAPAALLPRETPRGLTPLEAPATLTDRLGVANLAAALQPTMRVRPRAQAERFRLFLQRASVWRSTQSGLIPSFTKKVTSMIPATITDEPLLPSYGFKLESSPGLGLTLLPNAPKSQVAAATWNESTLPPYPMNVEAQVAQAAASLRAVLEAGELWMTAELDIPLVHLKETTERGPSARLHEYTDDLDVIDPEADPAIVEWPGVAFPFIKAAHHKKWTVLQVMLLDMMAGATAAAKLFTKEFYSSKHEGVYMLDIFAGRPTYKDFHLMAFPTYTIFNTQIYGNLSFGAFAGNKSVVMFVNTQGHIEQKQLKKLNLTSVYTLRSYDVAEGVEEKTKVKVLQAYPCPKWQVFVLPPLDRPAELVTTFDREPRYRDVHKAVVRWRGPSAIEETWNDAAEEPDEVLR